MIGQGVRSNPARRFVVAFFFLCVSLALLWVPWTRNVGYSFLWSKPRERAIQNDIVVEARQRWDAEYRANDEATVAEKLIAPALQADDKEKAKQELKRALGMAKLKQVELNNRQTMSDEAVLNWLDQGDNFRSTFPDKANLDESGRKKIIREWKEVVFPAREWNERVRYADVDYRRIAIELAALIGLLAFGWVLTSPRNQALA